MKKKIHESPKDQQQHISIIVDERKNFHNGELTSGKTLEVFLLQSPITRELLLYFSQLTISLIEKRFIMTPLKSQLIFFLFVPFKIPQLPQKPSTHFPDFSPRKSSSAAAPFSFSSHHSFLHFFLRSPYLFSFLPPLPSSPSKPAATPQTTPIFFSFKLSKPSQRTRLSFNPLAQFFIFFKLSPPSVQLSLSKLQFFSQKKPVLS